MNTVSGGVHCAVRAYNIVFHDYEIQPILRHLKNTAPGIDNLPSWLFRTCSYELAGVIADLYLIFHFAQAESLKPGYLQ